MYNKKRKKYSEVSHMADFGIDLWRRIKNVFGVGDADAKENELNDTGIFEKKSKDSILNKTKNFFTGKELDEKWFPYKCQQLSKDLKEYYVLDLEEFKDIISKAIKKRLETLMGIGDKKLKNAYEKWKEAFDQCKVKVKGKEISLSYGSAVVVPLKTATQNYWDAARDILSKPIMNESYIKQLIAQVQNLPPAEKILKLHGIEVLEGENEEDEDKMNKKKK